MAQSTCYVGESGGNRILALGGGLITQVGTSYQVVAETWPVSPAGPAGDVLFRLISVAFECTGGYYVQVTPIVDGVAQAAQVFSGGDTGRVIVQAYVAVRGTAIAARFETLARYGPVTLLDMSWSGTILRQTP